MERENKPRRPRIGESKSVAGRDGSVERYEKVDYSRRTENTFNPERRPRINNGERNYNRLSYGENDKKPYNGNRQSSGYNRTNNYGDAGNRSYNNDRPYNKPYNNRPYNNDRPRYNSENNDRPYRPANRPAYGNNSNNGNRPIITVTTAHTIITETVTDHIITTDRNVETTILNNANGSSMKK